MNIVSDVYSEVKTIASLDILKVVVKSLTVGTNKCNDSRLNRIETDMGEIRENWMS